jgi:hypothetical protein
MLLVVVYKTPAAAKDSFKKLIREATANMFAGLTNSPQPNFRLFRESKDPECNCLLYCGIPEVLPELIGGPLGVIER